jgi:hypothetical protein
MQGLAHWAEQHGQTHTTIACGARLTIIRAGG